MSNQPQWQYLDLERSKLSSNLDGQDKTVIEPEHPAVRPPDVAVERPGARSASRPQLRGEDVFRLSATGAGRRMRLVDLCGCLDSLLFFS